LDNTPNRVIVASFCLMVASFHFEMPDGRFHYQLPSMAAALFTACTALQPRVCYRRLPAALLWSIAFLFAFRHFDHERKLAAALRAALPDIPIAASHEVLPVFREYERTSTTVAEAYLRPKVAAYMAKTAEISEKKGVRSLRIMTSSGGRSSGDMRSERPVPRRSMRISRENEARRRMKDQEFLTEALVFQRFRDGTTAPTRSGSGHRSKISCSSVMNIVDRLKSMNFASSSSRRPPARVPSAVSKAACTSSTLSNHTSVIPS